MRQPVTMRQAGQRSWLTLAFVVLGVLALSLSNVEPASARTAATSLSAGAGDTHANGILQETARQVSAKGRWWRDRDERYLGGRALSARQKGASLAVTFTGTGLRIVGPRSLTRGRARAALTAGMWRRSTPTPPRTAAVGTCSSRPGRRRSAARSGSSSQERLATLCSRLTPSSSASAAGRGAIRRPRQPGGRSGRP